MEQDSKTVSRETMHPAIAALSQPRRCPKCGTEMVRDAQRWRCNPCRAAYTRAWRKKHPMTAEQSHKDNVRSLARAAMLRGEISIQPCKCGAPGAQMHHEDYSKPLEVIWLCAPCHTAEHYPNAKANKEKPRRRMVQHRGALCSKCLEAPPRAGQRYCQPCHNAAERAYRKAKRAAHQAEHRLALEAIAHHARPA